VNLVGFLVVCRDRLESLRLSLQHVFVQGEQPHCGFPEKNFSDNAEKLARKVHDGFVTL
jgi:hypothetical protein